MTKEKRHGMHKVYSSQGIHKHPAMSSVSNSTKHWNVVYGVFGFVLLSE